MGANSGESRVAPSAGDVLAGLAAVCLVSVAAEAAPHMTSIDADVARLYRTGGIAGGLPVAGDRRPVLIETNSGTHFRLAFDGAAPRLVPILGKPDVAPTLPDILPDGEVTVGEHDLAAAWLAHPSERYGHGILGDRIEAAALRAELSDGQIVEFTLDADSVFEDRRARLADLDGDGADEIIVVRSRLRTGAALAVFGVQSGRLALRAETPPIGTSYRWLNPAAAADFDGDGVVEIAYVVTPHIGGTLKLDEYRNGALVADHAVYGFSNHALGSRVQDMAALIDWDGDGVVDIALPDARRLALRIMSFAGGQARELYRAQHAVPIETAILSVRLTINGNEGVAYGLVDGTLILLAP